MVREVVAALPVGRIGAADDVWRALRFIVECDDFNGRCVDVDGGLATSGRGAGRGRRPSPGTRLPPFSSE
jgi:hypothetical protein